MGLGTLALIGVLWAPGQAAPAVDDSAPLLKLAVSKLDIPIKVDPTKKDQIQDLILYVSADQGKVWQQYAMAKPDGQFFTFTAPEDGVYWFNMMIVDKQGSHDPAKFDHTSKPAFKVLIDTKPPAITIRQAERIGDEIVVAWEIQDTNPDWSRFVIEYRVGDAGWISVDAKGAPSGSTKFRVASPGALTVRLQAYDLSGNRSEMARAIPAQAQGVGSSPAPQPAPVQQSSARLPSPSEVPPPASPEQGVPIIPQEQPLAVGRPEKPAPVNPAPPAPVEPMVRNDTSVPSSPLAVSQGNSRPSGIALPPVQVINVARFDLAYEVEQKGPSGISKVEIWVTRDDGRSWQKWSSTEKTDGTVTVDLATKNNPQVEGVYGIKIVLQSGAGLSSGPPVSGEAPEMRVDVDLTPPVVTIYEPLPDPNQKDTMVLRWQANDRNMAVDPITLEWSEQSNGPWNPIVSSEGGTAPIGSSAAVAAKRLPHTSQYAWKLPPNFPTHRVYVRISARDTAGNIGTVVSPHPILVDMNKPVAKIHGIIGAAPTTDRR